jgi:hypothetical protein
MKLYQKIEHKDSSGNLLVVLTESYKLYVCLGNEEVEIVTKADVQTLINYLQNWVDTGDFEGTKEAKSND